MKRCNLLSLVLLGLMVGCGPSVTPPAASPSPTAGQIAGHVLDAATGAPINGANVTTDPPTSSVTTGADGTYSIPFASPNRYVVTASKDGFTTADVEIAVTAGKTATADIQLLALQTVTPPPGPTSAPTQSVGLEAVEVSAVCEVYGQSPVKVERGHSIILSWQWVAAKAELIQQHLDSARYRVLLDGKDVQAGKVSEVKFIAEKNSYQITWYTDPMTLDVGTHVTERYLSWSRQISDGWHTYGPGGAYETLHDTCTIIIE